MGEQEKFYEFLNSIKALIAVLLLAATINAGFAAYENVYFTYQAIAMKRQANAMERMFLGGKTLEEGYKEMWEKALKEKGK